MHSAAVRVVLSERGIGGHVGEPQRMEQHLQQRQRISDEIAMA